ncbi:major facilitator superfamily transporter [Xylariomycetidae sp. FL0641]|nr:major facilitator superfamily transporter [Xylariomycetidae sp. FL0641]
MDVKSEKSAQDVPCGKIDIEEVVELDDAEVFLRDNNFSNEYVSELLQDEPLMKRLVRKVDLVILPLLAGTYTLQYIDKQALSYAAVFDLFTDTGISETQYGWFASIFYFAYLVAEYPWSALAQRTRMAKVVGGCVTTWGAVLMLTAACSNFGGLAACRFLLGIFEAPITPCFMMLVSMWYVREEQPFRAGVFYSCNGVGSMVSGVLFFAVGQIQTFPVWKIIFLLCGGITIVWGVILLVFLPDSIIDAKRFTLQEKAALIGRGKLGRTGILHRQIRVYQIKEALLDPQVWLLTFFTLLNETVNGGIANFGKLIIKGLVHDPLKTTALGIPQGGFQVFYILTGTYLASRFRNSRTFIMALYVVPTIIGTSLVWKLDREDHKSGLLVSYYIIGSFVASLVVALQMPAANLGGYTKRVTGTALVFLAYCVGNVIGPHAFLEEESPTYPTGCKVIIGCAAGQIATAMCLRLLLIRRNKRRDAAAAAATSSETAVEEISADLTDFENPQFRYVL